MTGHQQSPRELAASGDVVRIVQLTDTHLKGFSGGTLLGLDTDFSLQTVIDLVRSEYPAPDLLLGTGDLADNGAEGAYRRLHDYLEQITPHHYWLPGNHDIRDVMVEVAGQERLPGELRIANWQVLMLDSQLPGKVGGYLGTAELQRLEAALERGREDGLDTLVCLHHQPVPVGSAWLDEQMVADAADFFSVLSDFSRVRGVLWGHVHQEMQREHDGLLLMCSPSTCVQFLPRQVGFAVDELAPGYRWIELHPDGSILSGVSRVQGQQFSVDREAGGYL